MRRDRLSLAVACCAMSLSLALAGGAHAAIISLAPDDTHVGSGFATSTPGLTDNPVEGVEPPAGDKDDLWGFSSTNGQALYGSGLDNSLGGQVWVSRADGSTGEDNPLLTTTISGLDNGATYNIYLYHVTHDDQSWGLQVGLSGGPLTTYRNGDGLVLEETSTSNLERVLMFTAAPTAGEILVDIDDQPAGGANRGFFKGLGVAVIPEPSSLVLLILGGLAVGAAVRRRCS